MARLTIRENIAAISRDNIIEAIHYFKANLVLVAPSNCIIRS